MRILIDKMKKYIYSCPSIDDIFYQGTDTETIKYIRTLLLSISELSVQ